MRRFLFAILIVVWGTNSAWGQSFVQTDLFVPGAGGCGGFRIPAIVKAANGDLLAFAECRDDPQNDLSSQKIVYRIRQSGTWGAQLTAAGPVSGKSINSPSPVLMANGNILLLYMRYTGSTSSGTLWATISTDNGVTFSAGTDISATATNISGGGAAWAEVYLSYTGLLLASGKVIFPVLHCSSCKSYVISTIDNGSTFAYGADTGVGGDEASVVEMTAGNLLLNVRAPNFKKVANSTNSGDTWGSFSTSTLADSVTGTSGSQIKITNTGGDGNIWLLFSNPKNPDGTRSWISVQRSQDGGGDIS